MTDRHPYVTAPGYLVKVLTHFKKSFPQVVTAETLKKLGFAPKNESYILNILRFLGLIDQEGNKTPEATRIFSLHDTSTFAEEFGKMILESYADLFELHGDDTWTLDIDNLMTFFRSSDETTDRVGQLQASTFRVLASFAGHGEVMEKTPTKQTSASPKAKETKGTHVSQKKPTDPQVNKSGESERKRDIGLTVRIEINLPADGTQETYDRIFRSIRENLLDV